MALNRPPFCCPRIGFGELVSIIHKPKLFKIVRRRLMPESLCIFKLFLSINRRRRKWDGRKKPDYMQ